MPLSCKFKPKTLLVKRLSYKLSQVIIIIIIVSYPVLWLKKLRSCFCVGVDFFLINSSLIRFKAKYENLICTFYLVPA